MSTNEFSKAFYRYRALMHDIETFALLNLSLLKKGCICCPRLGEDGLFAIALDGCYRLCRKRNAGDSANFASPRISHFHVSSLDKAASVLNRSILSRFNLF